MELSKCFFQASKKEEEKDMDCRRSLLKFNRFKILPASFSKKKKKKKKKILQAKIK